METKRKIGICLISVLAALLWWGQVAAGLDIYGYYFTGINYGQENKAFLGPPPEGDFCADLGGNLYFSHWDQQLYHFFLDLKFEGSLANQKDQIAPVEIRVNQLFLQVPLADYAFLYCGKRIKETGVSRFFNVSNRISPKFLADFDYQRNAPGFIEINMIPSDRMAHGLILYFHAAKNWDQVSTAVYADFSHGNFSVDGHFYYEELAEPAIGVNLSYQWGVCQLYLESILKSKAEQSVVKGDTADPFRAFVLRDLNCSLEAVFGLALTKDDWSFTLEYLNRQEGYNWQEQQDYMEHIKAFGLGGVPYSRCALLQNYLGVSWSKGSFAHPNLAVGLSGLFSFQPVREEFTEYASYELSGRIGYMFSQNCELTLYNRYVAGGKYGEFNKLFPEKHAVALVLSYLF